MGDDAMRISPEQLSAEADSTGFRLDVLEKVAQLLGLLNALPTHPVLRGKLALKGGTALNLFILDVPRLSVDIDLNYVGTDDLESMQRERPDIVRAVTVVSEREGFVLRHSNLGDHAGVKLRLQYSGALGQAGNLEVDINFIFRVPLWPIARMDSRRVGAWQATGIPVMDIHELVAGKLAALLSRKQARDLFDSVHVLKEAPVDRDRLRLALVVYCALNRENLLDSSPVGVEFKPAELAETLIPTLRVTGDQARQPRSSYGRTLVAECRTALSSVLPFTEPERAFIRMVGDRGEIAPELLTADKALQERIRNHPALAWKAWNVRKYRGLP